MDTTSNVALLTRLTADELDERGRTGNVILMDSVPCSQAKSLPKLAGGWIAKYVGMTSPGSTGRVVLLPAMEWNRKLWRQGQYAIATAAGLTGPQAVLWMSSSAKAKHDETVLARLVQVLANDRLRDAYLAYEPDGSYNDFLRWSARNDVVDELTASTRRAVVTLLREILDGEARAVQRAEAEVERAAEKKAEEARRKDAEARKVPKKPKPKHRSKPKPAPAGEPARGVVESDFEGDELNTCIVDASPPVVTANEDQPAADPV